jgi:hypothetical protein
VVAALAEIPAAAARLESPVLLVVGEVVSLADRLGTAPPLAHAVSTP